MKQLSILILTAVLLIPSLAFGDACTNKLVGSAVNSTAANAICESAVSAVGQDLVPGTDGTYDLGTSTAEWQDAYIDGTLTVDGMLCDGDQQFSATTFAVYGNTADAADNQRIILSGGGSFGDKTRGAYLTLNGNEHAGVGGVSLLSGNAAGTADFGTTGAGSVRLFSNDAVIFTANSTGELLGSGTATLGWTVQAGADTACTTTCTTPCVMGFADTGGVDAAVGCADATADSCLCAGAS